MLLIFVNQPIWSVRVLFPRLQQRVLMMKQTLTNPIGHVIEIVRDRGQGHRHRDWIEEGQLKADIRVTGIVIDPDRGVDQENDRGLGNDLVVIAMIGNPERNDLKDHDLEAEFYCPHKTVLK